MITSACIADDAHRVENMQVGISHFEDRSEPATDGTFDYVYVYDIYTFTDADRSISVRRYADEPSVAFLLDTWRDLPKSLILLAGAIKELRRVGVERIKVLDPVRGAYSDLAVAAEHAQIG